MNFITVKVREKPSVEGLRWKKFWELDTDEKRIDKLKKLPRMQHGQVERWK